MAFQCVVVTPESQVVDRSCDSAVLPAHDGQVGILTGRAPLLVKLGEGELVLDGPGGGRETYFVDGGVAQMKGGLLTVLTDGAMTPGKIDPDEARAELAEATAETPHHRRRRRRPRPADAAGAGEARRRRSVIELG